MCPTNSGGNANTPSSRIEAAAAAARNRNHDTLKPIDDPPPVLNREKGRSRIHNQTPQHLATLVAPTSSSSLAEPLVVQKRFFVWGLAEGKIGLWASQQFVPGQTSTRIGSVSPAFVLETNTRTPWIQMREISFQKKNDDNESGNTNESSSEILCLTSAGVFYSIKICAAPTVKLEITRSWHTKQCGTSCFCVTKSNCIVVGYLNGQVEAWRDGKRLWFGHFDAYPVIRSIAPVAVKVEGDSSSSTSTPEFIMMTLEPPERSTTALMFEVIMLSEDMVSSSDKNGAISLEDFWVLPEAGSEILDSAALTESHRQETNRPFDTHWIPSHGSHVVTYVHGTENVWVEMADGSVIFLEAVVRNGRLHWGVQDRARGQYLLSYPSIGRGVVTLGETLYAVCALRGATVYFFSLDPAASGEEVRSCHYPDDISTDAPMQHLQNFVAGDVVLPLSDEEASYPLLFFCWPGGIVDVYCSHLLSPLPGCSDEISTLFDNGTVEDLSRLLQSLSDDLAGVFDDTVWAKAREEVLAFTQTTSSMTLEDIESSSLVHFQELLKQLADHSSDKFVDF